MEMPSCRQCPVEQPGDISRVAVQPAARLDEIEEEDACQSSECERVPVCAQARGREAVGEPVERAPERSEEPRCDALAGEDLTDPQGERERRFALPGSQPFECRQSRAGRL